MTDILARPTQQLTVEEIGDEDAIDLAVKQAVLAALRDHKQAGNPIAVWENGAVKIVQPGDIVLPEDTSPVEQPEK